MASESKKRKCKNTAYDRGGEKGKVRHFKGYAMYHKKDRVAANKEAVIDEEDIIKDMAEDSKSEILKHLDSLMICVGNAYNTSHYLLESDMKFIEKQEKIIKELLNNNVHPIRHGQWIYDGDCMITSCCNTAYDIDKFERKDELILAPCKCPNCGADMRGKGNG